MGIEKALPLVDSILSTYVNQIGRDYEAYRNHVYRVVNLCFAGAELGNDEKEKIQIAACFHDIGIWTTRTLDYLPPSEAEAKNYLLAVGKQQWCSEIGEMIVMHHRVQACADSEYHLVELFRRADVADFSLGLIRMGFSRELISGLKLEFPNAGFHKRLLQLGLNWTMRHPFNPLPMFRW